MSIFREALILIFPNLQVFSSCEQYENENLSQQELEDMWEQFNPHHIHVSDSEDNFSSSGQEEQQNELENYSSADENESLDRIILVDANRRSVKPVKFPQTIEFQTSRLAAAHAVNTANQAKYLCPDSIYRFTIKLFLSVLPHFFYISRKEHKIITQSQIILRDNVYYI
jgi:hypothetical protein